MSPFANDPYCYPGTDVLKNADGIRDRNAPSFLDEHSPSLPQKWRCRRPPCMKA